MFVIILFLRGCFRFHNYHIQLECPISLKTGETSTTIIYHALHNIYMSFSFCCNCFFTLQDSNKTYSTFLRVAKGRCKYLYIDIWPIYISSIVVFLKFHSHSLIFLILAKALNISTSFLKSCYSAVRIRWFLQQSDKNGPFAAFFSFPANIFSACKLEVVFRTSTWDCGILAYFWL